MAPQWGRVLALCVLVMVAGQAHAQGGQPVNENVQYMSGSVLGPLYHSSDDILTRLNQMSRGPLPVSLVPIQDTQSDSSHSMYRIMQRRQSPPAFQPLQTLPTVFIICNQHAREAITAEMCFWLIRLLSGDSRTLLEWPEFRAALAASPVAVRRLRGGNANIATLRNWTATLTTRVKVEVVPIVNIDGRRQIETDGDYNLRKNPNGVDLNRNWRVNRAAPGSGVDELDPNSEVYGGPSPLSEWETRSLYAYMQRELAGSARLSSMFMDVHSGMWALMSPWSGKFDMTDISMADISASQVLLDAMQPPLRDCNGRGIAAGPGAGILYRAYGSADDTAGRELRFRQAMTAEIYGPIGNDPYVYDSGWSYDCPRLREFRSNCIDDDSNPGDPCGSSACRNMDGMMLPPQPYMRSASLAAFVAAEASIASEGVSSDLNSTTGGGASTSKVTDQGANGQDGDACPLPQQPQWQQLNTAGDPFMQHRGNGDFATFKYFNPVNAAQYRDAVGRWCVGMLLAIDSFVTRPPAPPANNVLAP